MMIVAAAAAVVVIAVQNYWQTIQHLLNPEYPPTPRVERRHE